MNIGSLMAAATAVLFLLSGCDSSGRPAEPDALIPMSSVLLYSGGPGLPVPAVGPDGHPGLVEVLVAPDSVRAGEAFTVSVRTSGDGCWSQGTMEVSAGAGSVVLRPYDLYSGSEICAAIYRVFLHPATLRFEAPGEAVIRVVGRKVTDGNRLGGSEIVIEKTLVVLE